MDKKYIYEIAEKIFSIDSPSGYTQTVIQFLKQEAESMGYETALNHKGNLMITVEGKDNSRTVGVSAHTDTLGLMVRSISSDGTLKFTKLGGPQLPTLDGEYCRIHTRDNKVYTGTILSTSPASHVFPDAESLARDCDNMMIRIDEKKMFLLSESITVTSSPLIPKQHLQNPALSKAVSSTTRSL